MFRIEKSKEPVFYIDETDYGLFNFEHCLNLKVRHLNKKLYCIKDDIGLHDIDVYFNREETIVLFTGPMADEE